MLKDNKPNCYNESQNFIACKLFMQTKIVRMNILSTR